MYHLKDGDRSKLIFNIRRILLNLSGGNIIGMLSDVLRRNEREELNSKYIKALENIAKVYLNKKQQTYK
jgi:hypothetical protein